MRLGFMESVEEISAPAEPTDRTEEDKLAMAEDEEIAEDIFANTALQDSFSHEGSLVERTAVRFSSCLRSDRPTRGFGQLH